MSTARINGRHVTAIVSAVCVAIVLAPVAVLASSAPKAGGIERVYITDPHHSANRASVSSTGALSVRGTVDVGNLPPTQNVSGSVNVGNLPSTQNVSGSVTAIPGLPGTPFTDYGSGAGATESVTVPAGKHLVIQTISVRGGVTSGDNLQADVDYVTNGVTGFVLVPLTYAYTNSSLGYDFYVGTVSVDVYADPGSTVELTLFSPTGTFDESLISVSGYLTT